MIELVNAIIIISLIVIIYKYFEKNSYDVVMVKSESNGKQYLVRNLPDKQAAANLLGSIAIKLENLVQIIKTSGYESVYNTVQNDDFLGYEVAYAKDKNGTLHPVFEVEDEFKNAVQKPYFYFKVNSQPTYWETKQFDEMELRVYIFICTTRCYIPCFNNGIHAAHMWLTTVILDKNNNGITNVFDTNSTNIYNMQYARGIEILAKIPVITPARTHEVSVGRTLKLHYLSCQNEYYSDANPNTEPCIGLQNREVWGFCQTFALLMYLVILHNPILAKEDLDEVIRRPGLDRLMYTLGGMIGFGKFMAELSDKKLITTPLGVDRSGFASSSSVR